MHDLIHPYKKLPLCRESCSVI